MSNTQRASLVDRLGIVTILLGLSFGPGVSALAQTQVAASSAARPVASAGEKKGGHHPAANRTAASENKAEAVRASTVRNVTVRRDGNDLLATIELDGQASFDHFTLTGPHRVVVDVRKTSNQATPLLGLGESGIERVRTGNFQGSVRIVFDATSRQQYQISRDGSRILVRFPGKADPRGLESNAKAGRKSNLPGPAPLTAAVTPTPKPEAIKTDRKSEAARTEAASVKPVAVPTPNQPLVKPTPAKSETRLAAAPVISTPSSEKGAQKASAKPGLARPEAEPEMTAKANDKAAVKEARVLPFAARAEKPHRAAAAPPAQPTEKKLEVVSKAAADKAPVIAPLPAVSKRARLKMTPASQPKQAVPVPPTLAMNVPKPVANAPKPVANVPKPAVVAERKAEPAVQPKPAPVETKAAPVPARVAAPLNQKHEAASPSQPHDAVVASAPQPKLAPAPVATPAPVSTPAPRVADKPTLVFNANDYRREGFTGEPIKLDLKSVDIREVLRFIADTYKVNFVVDKSVSDSVPVTVSVEEVPWNQALDALLKSNRLGIQVEGNILRVMAQSAIAEEDDVRRKQRDAQLQAAPLVTELVRLNYARAFMGGDAGGGSGGNGGGGGGGGGGGTKGGLEAVIKSRLSTRGTIEPDSRTNTLVITDVPENIAIIKDMIRKLDVPEPQVEIEARIVIANRNFARDLGVQLGAVVVGNKVGTNGVGAFSTMPNPPGPAAPSGGGSGSGGSGSGGSGSGSGNGGLFGAVSDTLRAAGANSVLGLTTGLIGTAQITAILSAAESKGNVKTISTPRITAQNNQKANIVNGVQIPVQTETNNTVTVSFVTAALKLEITPQITSLGTVMLHVIAENNSVNLAIATRNAPGINTQRAETQVLVPDGGTTIIGGINIETESNSQQRTPGISRIPGLGELFKRRILQRSNDEILFFITPRVYKTLEAPVLTSGSGEAGAAKN